MKGKLTALVMAMAMVFLAVTAGLAAKVLFEDKFATLDPSWGVPSANLSAKDGKLIINVDQQLQYFLNQAIVLPNDLEANYTVAFVKAGVPNSGSGLIFWAKDQNDFYCLLTNALGRFAVQRLTSGRWLVPVAWSDAPPLKKGEGAENQVKVVTKGNQATIFINDKEVVSFAGQPPEGGSMIGFLVAGAPGGSNSVAFSSFQVVQP